MIPLIWRIAALVGFALALAFGQTWRRTGAGALVLLGLARAVACLIVGYSMATPSDQPRDCSDCYVYLRRWWEPGLAVFISD